MQLILFCALFLLGFNAVAQDCPKYAKAMAAGNGFFYKASPDYDSALVYFQVALVAARECRISNEATAAQLKKVFEGLKAQRDEAVKAKQEAVNASQKTKAALAKAQKLIDAFYFYEDRFALSVKQVEAFRKYGFINKNGDVVIPYRYEYAEQFDYSGFAKVKKKDHWGEVGGGIFDYLIDTSGKEYLVCTEFPDSVGQSYKWEKEYSAVYLPGDTSGPWRWQGRITFDFYADALDFRNKQLRQVPSTIGEFKQFQILLLHKNHLFVLPPSIGSYKALTVLDVGGNDLRELPAETGNLENLKTLLLGNNQLKLLPDQIGNLKKLETLDLGANSLENIPASVGRLTALKKLVLRSNPLKSLPSEIGHLQQLRILNIADLRLGAFPTQIGQLSNLEIFNISGTDFKTFSGLRKLTKLHTLDISFMGLKSLPPEIFQLKQLRKLHVYGNWDMTDTELKRLKRQLPNCQIINAPLYDVMEILND